MAAAGHADTSKSILEFKVLHPAPDVAFWQRLTAKKLDELRLDARELRLAGHFEAPVSIDAEPKCFFRDESLDESSGSSTAGVLVRGFLKNFNTSEEFRNFLKGDGRGERVAEALGQLRGDIVSGEALRDPAKLRPVLMVTFADLKKYHYAYVVAFPTLCPPVSLVWRSYQASVPATEAGFSVDLLRKISRRLKEDVAFCNAGAFLLDGQAGDEWNIHELSTLLDGSRGAAGDGMVLGFVDPSSTGSLPGWPLRNLLMALAHHRPGRWRVLAFRDPHLSVKGDAESALSRVFYVDASAQAAESALASPLPPEVQFAGWSKVQNFDLTVFLDKRRIASDAVDLNIKLMKWRFVPELMPERVKEMSVLLLGAGTLGCSVARALMGWGIRRMTFVDSGKVSFSNPVRQSLFTHLDAAESRLKSVAAAEAVKAIMPDADVQAVELEIPMPGHPHLNAEVLRKASSTLDDLISKHDVVFMLTDSRESRWLPALLVGTAQRRGGGRPPPLGVTVALGVDSFLVCRQTYGSSPAACYFCNDVAAPTDSLAFRTLDQQCTVTRPGLSPMASGVAVELLISLLHHPDGFAAGYPGKAAKLPLGQAPHQIRGYLDGFRLAPAETEPFSNCICCSKGVLEQYENDGLAFVERVVRDSSELEALSGLMDMKAAVRDADVMSFNDLDDLDDM